jgi:hypothetical protein
MRGNTLRHKFFDPQLEKAAAIAEFLGSEMRVTNPAAAGQPIGPSAPQNASQPSGTTGTASNGAGGNPALPFTDGARYHREQIAIPNNSFTLAAGQINEIPINAYGFARGILLQVTATAGTGSAAVASADAPFNVLGPMQITDPDGAPIYNVDSGYTAMLIQKYGGYFPNGDPRQDGFFSNVATTGNFQFMLYIPLEIIERNALGALPNTDSGKQYKMNLNFNGLTTVYATNPTGTPTVTVTAYLVAWTQPPPQDVLGRTLTRVPPLVGTTQYWSRQSIPVNAGQSNGQTWGRVGNIVRGWILTYRNASGVRQDSNWPAVATLYRDGYNYDVVPQSVWQQEISQRYNLPNANDTAGGRDTGVYPYMFHHDFDGKPGNELRGLWWPTLQSSRIELDGSYGAAGTLSVITNDIAPTGDVANHILI